MREEVLKSNFIPSVTAAAKREAMPKAMFKFGANHLYHGRNPTNAHPIGNLAHELAIFNGKTAYGLFVLPWGQLLGYKDLPPWLLPVLPAQEPTAPVLIDRRAAPLSEAVSRPGCRGRQVAVARPHEWLPGHRAVARLPARQAQARRQIAVASSRREAPHRQRHRYVTPLREGGSLPAIVEADDAGMYVLKFRGCRPGSQGAGRRDRRHAVHAQRSYDYAVIRRCRVERQEFINGRDSVVS